MATSSNGLRLYMFECGSLKCQTQTIKMNQGLGEEYEIPVPWYLVEVSIKGQPLPEPRTNVWWR